MFAREKAAGFVIQIAREKIAETAIYEPEHNRMAIDRVRCRMATEGLFVETDRFMPHARSSGRLAQETQRGLACNGRHKRPENFNPKTVPVEEVECIGITELKPPEFDR